MDVRIIAATNRDLRAAGSTDFLPELLQRLKVLTIALLPLRDRGDDAILLAETFAAATPSSTACARSGCRRAPARSCCAIRGPAMSAS